MMKKVVLITSFTFFVLSTRIVTAIDWIEVNGSKETVVSQVGQNFLLTGNVSSPGARLACYFFLDVNNNHKIDATDKLVDFYLLTDGIGNIIDQSTREKIPGDEAKQSELVSTTLFTKANQCPPSSQNWIIKAVDQDQTEAFAYVKWDLQERDCVVNGSIKNTSLKAQHVVFAVETGFPANKKMAIVNSNGQFELYLEPNDWQIFAESAVYPFAPSLSKEVFLNHKERVENLHITFPGKNYFAEELVADLRAPDSEIISENYSSPQKILTGKSDTYFSDYEFVYENTQDAGIQLKETRTIAVNGLVLIGPETPAQNINIVARHEWEKGPKGYLFTTTNKEGRFRLETEIEGDWKIGVACDEFKAHPGIQYCYLSEDRNISNLIFNLLPKPKKMLPAASDFRASLNSK